MRTFLALALVSFVFVGNAKAEEQDGSYFLRACSAHVKETDGTKVSQEESILAFYCISYVAGFLDAMSITVTTTKGTKVVCAPERGIVNDQAVRIFVKYLRENPETLHQSGRTSLYIALAKAFPCKP
jgi:hypothetical protein